MLFFFEDHDFLKSYEEFILKAYLLCFLRLILHQSCNEHSKGSKTNLGQYLKVLSRETFDQGPKLAIHYFQNLLGCFLNGLTFKFFRLLQTAFWLVDWDFEY